LYLISWGSLGKGKKSINLESVVNLYKSKNAGATTDQFFFHLILFIADLSYVGFVPLGDFFDMLGDKKNDFGWRFHSYYLPPKRRGNSHSAPAGSKPRSTAAFSTHPTTMPQLTL
jgi:hypothetical protein